MGWRKSDAWQLAMWERKMFRAAPIRVLLREARGLLRLVEQGNKAAIPLIDKILEECLERQNDAVARDSEFWEELIRKAREGEKGGSN